MLLESNSIQLTTTHPSSYFDEQLFYLQPLQQKTKKYLSFKYLERYCQTDVVKFYFLIKVPLSLFSSLSSLLSRTYQAKTLIYVDEGIQRLREKSVTHRAD